MSFNIFDVFKLDFYSDRKLREMDKFIRPGVKSRTLTTEYRQHDRGRGQEINSEYSFQIPFRQQKLLYQRDAWVKRCIDHMAAAASSLNWQIVAKEKYMDDMDNDLHMQIGKELAEELFNRPNELKQSFSDLIKMIVRDLKIMDGSAIEKCRDANGRLGALKIIDAANLRIDIDAHGQVIKYIQEFRGNNLHGLYNHPHEYINARDPKGHQGIELHPNSVVYFKLNPRSEGPYGSSPIASLVEAIYADLATDMNLYHYLNTGGMNVGFMTIGQTIDNNAIERVRARFNKMSPGNRYNFPIVAATEEIKWNPMQITNHEAQMAELQAELRNKILAVLSIPPNELGLAGNTRGQVYSQQDVFWGGAIIPMMKSIAEKITDEILVEFDNRLKFEFLPPSEYQYEAIMTRIVAFEQEGLIDDDIKYRWLGLPKPKEETFVQKRKKLELMQLENSKTLSQLQLNAQLKNIQYIYDEPRLKYEQLAAQTNQLSAQGSSIKDQVDLQTQQIQLQKQQMTLEKMKLSSAADISPSEVELQKMQLQIQLMQAEAMLKQAQQGQPNTLSLQDIIDGIQQGKIDASTLAFLVERGQVDPEQLKMVNSVDRTVSGVSKNAVEEPGNGDGETENPFVTAAQDKNLLYKEDINQKKLDQDKALLDLKFKEKLAGHQNNMLKHQVSRFEILNPPEPQRMVVNKASDIISLNSSFRRGKMGGSVFDGKVQTLELPNLLDSNPDSIVTSELTDNNINVELNDKPEIEQISDKTDEIGITSIDDFKSKLDAILNPNKSKLGKDYIKEEDRTSPLNNPTKMDMDNLYENNTQSGETRTSDGDSKI
jgi:HK97 family phage portal protein